MTEIGTRLRARRLELRMTLRELEESSGVSNPLISQIETGHVENPGVNTVAKLARALRRRPSWIAFGPQERSGA